MDEIWKPVRNYEGWYEVSSCGRVRSVNRLIETKDGGNRYYKGKMLTAQCNKKRGNYYYVMLRRNTTRKTFRVNRLVLEAFNPVENMEELQVGHLDENPMNNNLDNLYWTTANENSNYGNHNLKLSTTKGGGVVQQLTVDGELIAEFPYAALAVKETGIKHIYSVLSGQRNTAGGYVWKYKEGR